MTIEFEDSWVEVQRFRERSEAEQHALVLLAMGIDCHVVIRNGGIALLVPASDLADARYQLAAYVRENDRSRRHTVNLRPIGTGIDAALVYCAAAVFVQAAARRDAFNSDWLAVGSAQAGLLAGGEWWRAITALGLHADFEHLAANLLLGSLFAVLVAQRLGPGLTWLAVVVAGGLGNALNAVLSSPTHTAIGASTAVFAALGLLAVLTWKRPMPNWRHQGLRRWMPLAAGAMLLTFLGMGGERTDVGAHILGFAMGCLAGLVLDRTGSRSAADGGFQLRCGGAALAIFAGSWMLALAS